VSRQSSHGWDSPCRLGPSPSTCAGPTTASHHPAGGGSYAPCQRHLGMRLLRGLDGVAVRDPTRNGQPVEAASRSCRLASRVRAGRCPSREQGFTEENGIQPETVVTRLLVHGLDEGRSGSRVHCRRASPWSRRLRAISPSPSVKVATDTLPALSGRAASLPNSGATSYHTRPRYAVTALDLDSPDGRCYGPPIQFHKRPLQNVKGRPKGASLAGRPLTRGAYTGPRSR
jgi:hypothetical protein